MVKIGLDITVSRYMGPRLREFPLHATGFEVLLHLYLMSVLGAGSEVAPDMRSTYPGIARVMTKYNDMMPAKYWLFYSLP